MKVRVIKNKEALLLIKKEWDKIFLESEYTIFQSFQFCYNSLNEKSKPFIICLENKEKINQIWPLEFISNRLRFINDTHADFCDILSTSESVIAQEYLKENNLLGKLRLRNLKQKSNIEKVLKNLSFYTRSASVDYSKLSLKQTENFPDNFTHFVYRQRRRLKRILKKYSADYKIYERSNDKFPIEEILSLRNEMIEEKTRVEDFLDSDFLDLAKKLYNSNNLIVSMIKSDGEVLGVSLLFRDKNNYSFWVDLYNNKPMVNLYHNIFFIKRISHENDAIFNFGRGAYNYKIQNFKPEIYSLYELNIFDSTFEVFLFKFSKKVKVIASNFYKKIKK